MTIVAETTASRTAEEEAREVERKAAQEIETKLSALVMWVLKSPADKDEKDAALREMPDGIVKKARATLDAQAILKACDGHAYDDDAKIFPLLSVLAELADAEEAWNDLWLGRERRPREYCDNWFVFDRAEKRCHAARTAAVELLAEARKATTT